MAYRAILLITYSSSPQIQQGQTSYPEILVRHSSFYLLPQTLLTEHIHIKLN